MDLTYVKVPKISQLTPGLESLMKALEMSIHELDDALERDQLHDGRRRWLDFWVWGMNEDEQARVILGEALFGIKYCLVRNGKVDLSRLKQVVAVLEGADEGSRLANLAVEKAEWMMEAKITIESLERLGKIY